VFNVVDALKRSGVIDGEPRVLRVEEIVAMSDENMPFVNKNISSMDMNRTTLH
jgi:hypothetical protein